MIVVYMPIYFHSDWCRREYKAMLNLEQIRLDALGREEHKLIIPLLYRDKPDDPCFSVIKDRKRYDFSPHFLWARQTAIDKSDEYASAIEEIANYVLQMYGEFQYFSDDECGIKEDFNLPTDDEALEWLKQQGVTISKKRPRRERFPAYQSRKRELAYAI